MKKETFVTMRIADAKAMYQAAKTAKTTVSGRINIAFVDKMPGLNVRSVYGVNVRRMNPVFAQFTTMHKASLFFPVVDFERNAVFSTNGKAMLIADIPDGTTIEDYKGNGYADEKEVNVGWWAVIDPKDRFATEYNLARMKRLAVIEKGGPLHNTLMGMAECAKSYEFTDEGGCWHTIYGVFGELQFNVRIIAALVTAVFRLGNSRVGLYQPLAGWAADNGVNEYAPMHIVGLDGGNNTRGLVMPIRTYGGEPEGFVFPTDDRQDKAA